MRLGLGLGIYYSANSGAGGSLGQSMALNHYNRVIADGGVLPCGVTALAGIINLAAAAFNVTTEAAFNAQFPSFLDAHWTGYKLGTGAGTTLGQAAQKVYSLSGASADVVQATFASQPLLLAFDSTNKYLFVPNIASNYCSTPHATANNITGDFDFQAEVSPYALNVFSSIATKYIFGSQRSFYWRIMDDAKLQIVLRVGGVDSSVISSAAYPYAVNLKRWVQVTRNSTTGDVKFYTSTDGITYTQLGTTQSGPTGALESANTPLEIGSLSGGAFSVFAGKIYRVKLSNTIGGAPVVDFNPNSYNAATSQTNWTSTTGEVYTLNVGTATTGYKACIVDRTIMQGDGVDDRLQATGLTAKTSFTRYIVERYTSNAVYMTSSNSNSALIYSNGAGILKASAATEVVFTGATQYTKFDLLTVNFGVSGRTQVNNANDATGDLTTTTGTDLFLFSGSSANYMCCFINTFIETGNGVVNDSTQRTAMYNIIRSMSNNAF